MHVNVVVSQVPPCWQSESSAQAPITSYYNCEDLSDDLHSFFFKDNGDDNKEHEHDDEDNCKENSIDMTMIMMMMMNNLI